MMKLTKGKIILSSIVVVLFFIFLMLSTIVKYWINDNSEELIGRKIEIAELHFNYAKLAARVKGFSLYELDQSAKFISFDELYVNINPWKLFSGEYSVSEIYLDGLNVTVVKNLDSFNFSDLLVEESEAIDSTNLNEEKQTVKFEIRDIKIKDGSVNYLDQENNNKIDLKDINIELPVIAWNNEKSEMGVNFSIGKNGEVSIDADVDHFLERYTIKLGAKSLDISPFMPYLKDYMLVSNLEGYLDTKLTVNGSMNDFLDVFVLGNSTLNNFSVSDAGGSPFLAAKSAKVNLDSIHVGSSYYKIRAIEMDSLVLYASLYPKKSNFETIFQPYLLADSIASATIAEEESDSLFYQIDTLSLRRGVVRFVDYTLNRKFVYDLNNIDVDMGTINAEALKIPVVYSLNLNDGGKSAGLASFSIKDVYEFHLKGDVERLDLMSFSPYTEFYIARPIIQGEFNYTCSINMSANALTNQNQLKISEFEFGEKTKDPNPIKAPVRLALYLLKDKNDLIKFDLPVSGNPKEPEFRVGKIIWKTLMNFLVKTAAQPFGVLGNLVGSNPESIEKVPFHFLQDSLDLSQMKTLQNIADILVKKPDLKFSFSQETDIENEKILLAVRECANRFFQSNAMENKIEDDQLLTWADSSFEFRTYIFSQINSNIDKSVSDNCMAVVGAQELSLLFNNLYEKRNSMLSNYLTDSLLVKSESFEMRKVDLRNLSEEQYTPKFRIEVSLR
ncbi:hypothetical protein BZG02_13305 [Labilibaculum filiforme]|uniref:DUF748 domain-containing protein n=1 Tax=Labilibaculum filiforme TaxID=1940526 RepID=A0A2N3HW30_9BACT|nr:DUF748 domain-containing protein [Labilibaculum filiforme]PKQ62285.1 hypothetical protein BZG02_13305 [Labilibaculum filiforme]